ncbi:MAG: hypothetical protein J5965_27255 [Aeriscardovia sp.]|nr:hypothetical protein [Aeriscardovia sp.]MBO6252110.1 hypothetical protein [Bacteroidaceae bacterium]
MCNNNSNDGLFDAIFGTEQEQQDASGNTLYDIITTAPIGEAVYGKQDTSQSSLEERYSSRVNLKIQNID